MNCKKLIYQGYESKNPTVLLGLIIHNEGDFVQFETAKGKHSISKKNIISISDTTEEFKSNLIPAAPPFSSLTPTTTQQGSLSKKKGDTHENKRNNNSGQQDNN